MDMDVPRVDGMKVLGAWISIDYDIDLEAIFRTACALLKPFGQIDCSLATNCALSNRV